MAKEAAPENPDIWTDEDNEIEFTIPKRTPKKTPKKVPEPTSDEAIFAVSVRVGLPVGCQLKSPQNHKLLQKLRILFRNH